MASPAVHRTLHIKPGKASYYVERPLWVGCGRQFVDGPRYLSGHLFTTKWSQNGLSHVLHAGDRRVKIQPRKFKAASVVG